MPRNNNKGGKLDLGSLSVKDSHSNSRDQQQREQPKSSSQISKRENRESGKKLEEKSRLSKAGERLAPTNIEHGTSNANITTEDTPLIAPIQQAFTRNSTPHGKILSLFAMPALVLLVLERLDFTV